VIASTPSWEERSKSSGSSRSLTLLAFAVLLGLYGASMVRQRNPMAEDDVLYFYRYADNLAAGNGYRFNAEEPPVCGASAPLWPVVLAAGEWIGLDVQQSSLAWSVLFSVSAAILLGLVALRLSGPLGVLCLAPLLSIYHLHTTWATSGMESPMTFLLVAAGLLLASGRGGWIALGLVGGLCLVHKVDLVPFGLILLGGSFLWRREHAPRALALAVVLATAWYTFAWATFGSPLPNSFLRKLASDLPRLPHSWFALSAFSIGGGALRAALAVVGFLMLRRRPFVATLAAAQVGIPALAYTLRPPAEGFLWYVVAISPALALLAASGLAGLLRARAGSEPGRFQVALATLVVASLGAWLVHREYPFVDGWHGYLTTHHAPMRDAGVWVDRNMPADARVITRWGYATYYSHRFVYDGSSLNRRPGGEDLFAKYAPEVWITESFRPRTEFRPPWPYVVVRVFEAPSPSDYFVAVLVRDPERAPRRVRRHRRG